MQWLHVSFRAPRGSSRLVEEQGDLWEQSYEVTDEAKILIKAEYIEVTDGWATIALFPIHEVRGIVLSPQPPQQELVEGKDWEDDPPTMDEAVDDSENIEETEEPEVDIIPRKLPGIKPKAERPLWKQASTYVSVLTVAGSFALVAADTLPPKYGAIAAGAGPAIFAAARGLDKLRSGAVLTPPEEETA